MAGGGGGATSTATNATTTRISSSVLGFSWCMKKPVALGSSSPPGARKANKRTEGGMSAHDNDTTAVDGCGETVTAVRNNNKAKNASPNPARDLAESLAAFGDVPLSPRKDSENTGERRARVNVTFLMIPMMTRPDDRERCTAVYYTFF